MQAALASLRIKHRHRLRTNNTKSHREWKEKSEDEEEREEKDTCWSSTATHTPTTTTPRSPTPNRKRNQSRLHHELGHTVISFRVEMRNTKIRLYFLGVVSVCSRAMEMEGTAATKGKVNPNVRSVFGRGVVPVGGIDGRKCISLQDDVGTSEEVECTDGERVGSERRASRGRSRDSSRVCRAWGTFLSRRELMQYPRGCISACFPGSVESVPAYCRIPTMRKAHWNSTGLPVTTRHCE